jgi:hypothetical protein
LVSLPDDNPFANLDRASAAIIRLNAELVAATTLPDLKKVEAMASGLRSAFRAVNATFRDFLNTVVAQGESVAAILAMYREDEQRTAQEVAP